MPELITRVARLVPYAKRPKTIAGYTTAYSHEPAVNQLASLGSLYVVIEVLTGGRQAEELADTIIETLGHHYYNQPTNPDDTITTLDRFETALKAVNRELTRLTNSGQASWVGKLSAVAAVQVGEDLHVCQTGSAEAFLFRRGRAINLGNEDKNATANPAKTFSDIASGELEAGDKLLLATPAVMHQLSQTELTQLITDNTPNAGVHKLSELTASSHQAERIALLIVEATTAELASLQVLPSESPNASLGIKQKPLEQVISVAGPMLEKSLDITRRQGRRFVAYLKVKAIPGLRRGALAVVAFLRQWLSSKRHRQYAGAGLILTVVALFWYSYYGSRVQAVNNLAKRYQAVFAREQQAEHQLAAGDKAGAKLSLVRAASDLKAIAGEPLAVKLPAKLAKTPHPEADPASVSALGTLIQRQLDQIDGLTTVKPALVQSFKTISGAKPDKFAIVASKAIFYDNSRNSLYSFDLVSNQLKTFPAAGVGKVVAMTASSADDGVFLLTDKPSVWFFRLEDNTLGEQTLSLASWPAGKSIASYIGNLYILGGDSQVYKFVRSAGGFSGKTAYYSSADVAGLRGASALAVDGSVYVGGGKAGLKRFLSGALKQTETDLPDTQLNPTSIQSFGDGSTLMMVDSKSDRIGLISFENNALSFKKQLEISEVTNVSDASVMPKASLIYILADGKLWRTALAF